MSNKGYSTYIIMYLFIMLAGITVTITSSCNLMRNGTPSFVRNLIIKRHISQILIFLVCNLYICLEAIYQLEKKTIDTRVYAGFKILFYL